jgi:hypothetical protein
MLEKTKKSILGYQFLIAEDYSSKEEIINKVKIRISSLELLDGDEEAEESIKVLKNFLKNCDLHQKKLDKLDGKENFYIDALRNTQKKQNREYILDKLNDIDNEKTKFL